MSDDFHAWLLHGLSKSWISDVVCSTHDGMPLTEAEADLDDEGYDDCVYAVRIYEDNIGRNTE